MTGEYSSLTDERETPFRWKAATLISVIGIIITLGTLFASGGAKSERLDAQGKRLDALEQLPPRVDRLEARGEDVSRRLGSIESKVDKLLERTR